MAYNNYRPGGHAWQRPTGSEASRFHDALRRVYPRTAQKSSGEPIYIDTPQGRRQAGTIERINGGLVFVKRVIESKHLHRKLDAWGIDASLLKELVSKRVEAIKVIVDTGDVEEVSVAKFTKFGIALDFGYNKQVFLPRRYFQKQGGSL